MSLRSRDARVKACVTMRACTFASLVRPIIKSCRGTTGSVCCSHRSPRRPHSAEVSVCGLRIGCRWLCVHLRDQLLRQLLRLHQHHAVLKVNHTLTVYTPTTLYSAGITAWFAVIMKLDGCVLLASTWSESVRLRGIGEENPLRKGLILRCTRLDSCDKCDDVHCI